MRRTPLITVLTLLAIVAATVVIAGCGGKSAGPTTKSGGTTSTHKLPSRPPSY
jgi:hypothetical protein